MAKTFFATLGDTAKYWGNQLYDWLGITPGSLTDIPGNHIRIGKVFLERGNVEEAKRRFKLALMLRKNSADAYAGLCLAYAALGDKKESVAAYQHAAKLGYAHMEQLKKSVESIDKPKVAPKTETSEVASPTGETEEKAV